MKRKTRILCSIFGFYLTLVLLVPQLLLTAEGHFLKPEVISEELVTRQAAQQVLELVLADGAALANSCGISSQVYEGVFTEDAILQDLQEIVNKALAAQAGAPDLEPEMERLAENIRQELKRTENVTDFTYYEGDIQTFCKQISNVYSRYINLPIYSHFRSVQSICRRVEKLAAVAAGMTGLVVLVLLGLAAGRGGLFLRELSFSVAAAGGLMAALTGVALVAKPFARLQISPIYLRDALRAYLHDGIAYGLYMGLATLAIGLILYGVSVWLIQRKRLQSNS